MIVHIGIRVVTVIVAFSVSRKGPLIERKVLQ